MADKIKKLIINQAGAAAVEFAIVLPVLLILIFGIIEFSVLLYNKAMITSAARTGARAGIVYNWPARTSDSEIMDVSREFLRDRLISFGGDPNGFLVALEYQDTDGDGNSRSRGDRLAVTVSHNHSFLVLPNFAAEMTGLLALTAKSTMRIE